MRLKCCGKYVTGIGSVSHNFIAPSFFFTENHFLITSCFFLGLVPMVEVPKRKKSMLLAD